MSTVPTFQVPVIPLSDIVGNVGTEPPAQIVSEVPKANVGVIFGATVTLNIVGTAHKPGFGVKVYVAEAWLSTTAGFQEPAMPLSDVDGKVGTVPPAQILNEVPKLNVGVTFGLTVTVKFTVVAHSPLVGVNV